MSLSEQQLDAITAAERATSILSVVGTSIIIATFLSSNTFRKPINRVVFYASWANISSNVGTLISRSAIVQGKQGATLCRFQAFLIQWFMPADALWTFAMAFNVYLTFFHKYDATKLRRLEWKYLLLCYGLPFIPPFVYFFINTDSKGPVYGSATLWCWIAVDWDILRIVVFYGPVWFVILLTFIIYARVGIDIAKKRRTLRSFNREADMIRHERLKNLFEIHASKVVHVTSEAANDLHMRELGAGEITKNTSDIVANNPVSSDNSHITAYPSYSVSVGRGEAFPMPPSTSSRVGSASIKIVPPPPRRTPRTDVNSAAFAYCKYAMLYFIALLVTWVPSTINRVYSLFYPTEAVFGLEFVSAFVLPLQGFWNSIIYIAVSWSTVVEFASRIRHQQPQIPPSGSTTSTGNNELTAKLKRLISKMKRRRSGHPVDDDDSRLNREFSKEEESTANFAKDIEYI